MIRKIIVKNLVIFLLFFNFIILWISQNRFNKNIFSELPVFPQTSKSKNNWLNFDIHRFPTLSFKPQYILCNEYITKYNALLWEVNLWNVIENRYTDLNLFDTYYGNHNDSIINNY